MNRKWYLPALILLLVGTVLILRNHSTKTEYVTHTGGIFGTVYKITYQGAPELIDTCIAALNDVDAALSMFNPESNLSRINRCETDTMCAMTREVLELAMEVSDATNGCFDITVGQLVNAWGFGYKSGELPDSATVAEMMRHVGFDKLTIDGNIIKLDSLAQLNCGAIAKGYGCDMGARTLSEHGVENYLVEIGVEVVVHGYGREGRPWRVGISRPDDTMQDVMTVMELTSGAMATSGNYRNYRVEADGRRIAHTIDPHSGYPVQHSLLSATVFAPSCGMADAYATSFMVMGLEGAKRILATHDELRAYLIYDEGGEMKVYDSRE